MVNVLFDLDGTLTDSRHGIVACIGHALAVLHKPIPTESDLVKFIGSPLREVFRELLATTHDDERIAEAVTAYRDRFADVGMFENTVTKAYLVLLRCSQRRTHSSSSPPRSRVFMQSGFSSTLASPSAFAESMAVSWMADFRSRES